MTTGSDIMATALLGFLADAMVRGIVVAAVAGLALLVLRPRRPAVRLWVWTLVLYAAMTLPLLGRAFPRLDIRFPAISALSRQAAVAAPIVARAFDARAAQVTPARSDDARRTVSPPATPASTSIVAVAGPSSATVLALAIYLTGVTILLLRALVGWLMTRRLERSSTPIERADVLDRARRTAAASGLMRPPRLAESLPILVPVTTSVLRPMIVFPREWRDWSPATLEAVLAHEMAHVSRRDLLTQRSSLIYRALCWPSPLAWWLRGQLAELAELASDEAALMSGIERTIYAETLVGFFTRSQAAAGRRAAWHLSMAHGAGRLAVRRVQRVLAWPRGQASALRRPAALALAGAMLPVTMFAATVNPVRTFDAAPLPEFVPVRPLTSIAEVTGQATPIARSAPHAAPSVPSGRADQSLAPVVPSPAKPSDPILTPAQVAGRRIWILLFDLASTPSVDFRRAVDASVRWVDEKMTDQDLVAVASLTDRQLQIIQDFTSDRSSVKSQLLTIGPSSSVSDPNASGGNVALRGIKTICDSLAAIQQHKAILYYTSGLRLGDVGEARAAENACARAQTSIDPIDVRGLMPATGPQTTAASTALYARTDLVIVDVSVLDAAGQTVADLRAEDFQIFENGVLQQLKFGSAAEANGATYYVLGYISTSPQAAGFHKIEVKVDRPHVRIRSRTGYYADDRSSADGYPEDTPSLIKPVLRERHEGEYTPEAARAKIQGDVVIEAVVGVDGRVARARITGSLDRVFGLDDAALAAVRQWTFTPGSLNGQNVPVMVRLVIGFRLR